MNKQIKIASWNVNSIKIRLEQVKSLLIQENIDILSLQETKIIDADFPLQVFTEMGYCVEFSGQKSYNGVAIISKKPITNIETNIPNFPDSQKRIIAASIADLRIINLYVPNGGAIDSEKYQYKLEWLNHITKFLEDQLRNFPNLIVVGDFNIAPHDVDVHDPKAWEGSTLVSAKEREALQNILNLKLYDSFRKFTQEPNYFTWWDYRAASFRRNLGLRIDLILVSEPLLKHCLSNQIITQFRKDPRPSDHAPVVITLEL